MPSDNDRLNAIVDTMVPATRNREARYLNLRFSFYPTHASFNAVDRPDMCIHCSDDVQLIAVLAELIHKARKRQQQEQSFTNWPPEPHYISEPERWAELQVSIARGDPTGEDL